MLDGHRPTAQPTEVTVPRSAELVVCGGWPPANLLAFASKVDTTEVGEPATLAVITATGYGYTRPDGVVVLPAAALGP